MLTTNILNKKNVKSPAEAELKAKKAHYHFSVTHCVTPQAPVVNPLIFHFLVLQGKHMGKGTSDGSYKYKQLFSCQPLCAMFVPFSKIKAAARSSTSPPTAQSHALPNSEELFVGDRVTYITPHELRHGMVMDIQEKDGQTMVRVSTVSLFSKKFIKAEICHCLCSGSKFMEVVTVVCGFCAQDTDENGMMGGEIEVSLNLLAKGEVPSGFGLSNHREERENLVDTPSVDHYQEDLYTDMSLGTLVELTLEAKKLYGTIRWIGTLPDMQETMAGLELVNKIFINLLLHPVKIAYLCLVGGQRSPGSKIGCWLNQCKGLCPVSLWPPGAVCRGRCWMNCSASAVEPTDVFANCHQEEEKGVPDGIFKGVRYFDCLPKRAMFVKLSACRPDSRFRSPTASHGGGDTSLYISAVTLNVWVCVGLTNIFDPISRSYSHF